MQGVTLEKTLIKVCLKIFNQGPVDPDHFFKRDQDRDEFFSGKVL